MSSGYNTMTDDEARYAANAVVETIRHYRDWSEDYLYHKESGDFSRKDGAGRAPDLMARFKAV